MTGNYPPILNDFCIICDYIGKGVISIQNWMKASHSSYRMFLKWVHHFIPFLEPEHTWRWFGLHVSQYKMYIFRIDKS